MAKEGEKRGSESFCEVGKGNDPRTCIESRSRGEKGEKKAGNVWERRGFRKQRRRISNNPQQGLRGLVMVPDWQSWGKEKKKKRRRVLNRSRNKMDRKKGETRSTDGHRHICVIRELATPISARE